ncbi:MAG: hypothetical protein IPM18_12685 [Phycisphaerales bacterium]|nr:hypothetical protein [Phycisphaerales bacterium]
MNPPLQIRGVRIHRLAIPMRVKFEHAAATRAVADPIVVELAAAAPYAQYVGFGETLARPYVTGESPASVVEDLVHILAPRLEALRSTTFAEALEVIEALPLEVDGRIITAARAALELALLDLVCRVYRRRPADVAGWLGLPGFGAPGCRATARVSGFVLGHSERKLKWLLRMQRLAGVRDFKLKVAVEGWQERLRWAHEVLGGAMSAGRATLRVDANAGWTLVEANEACGALERFGVCALEQPLSDAEDGDLAYLAEQTRCDLVADESLITIEDAQRLLNGSAVRVFNLRLAKNGGLLPALRIARLVLAAGRDVQLGCLVGETSVLAAAGVAFLEACPKVRFYEGGYGTLLLKRDISRRPVRVGLGARVRVGSEPGLGVTVDVALLHRLAAGPPRNLQF